LDLDSYLVCLTSSYKNEAESTQVSWKATKHIEKT